MNKSIAGLALVVIVSMGVSPVLGQGRRTGMGPHNLNPTFGQSGRICWYCHTPHTGNPAAPMWNRENPGNSYTIYETETLISTPGSPTGSSLLCLSCHDGTIAPNQTYKGKVRGNNESPKHLTGENILGTDLRDDHPVSIDYPASPEYVQPPPSVLRFEDGKVQCDTCHDPHDNTNGKFLKISNLQGGLCLACHALGGEWSASSHARSFATWNGSGIDPWASSDYLNVSDNACNNCHDPHSTGSSAWLLVRDGEELICAACHNGNVAGANVWSDFQKTYVHPVESSQGLHVPGEPALLDPVNSTVRHVECSDCHSPHFASSSNPFTGLDGVAPDGSAPVEITSESRLCYRCHSDSSDKPGSPVTRVVPENNLRLEFQPGNISSHPVEESIDIGNLADVPSLLADWTRAGTSVTCGDCHGSDSSVSAGGAGPEGPHGSIYPFILKKSYRTGNVSDYSRSDYQLCWQCHDPNVIEGNQSFGRHEKHINMVGCSVCHEPHGINPSSSNAGSVYNRQLVNFDASIVFPRTGGMIPYWEDENTTPGIFQGRCYLVCHGEDHDGWDGGG